MGERENIGWSLAFELAPAAIFGSAVAFAAGTFGGQSIVAVTPVAAGAGAFGATWLFLRKFGGERRGFPISQFEQAPAEYEQSSVAELLEQADVVGIVERLGATEEKAPGEELVLDEVVEPEVPDSRVVQLFQPAETAGEMRERIETHLRGNPRRTPPDATQELHDALAALRRSLR
ncbi:hypothetical protein GCM10023264_04660 [Sphingomonas daechungensis]|uniref:hypothetical protein n=1 Tax=Sphingomonas daechungensis TaxID=1176646 RepID=UPI0031F08750